MFELGEGLFLDGQLGLLLLQLLLEGRGQAVGLFDQQAALRQGLQGSCQLL